MGGGVYMKVKNIELFFLSIGVKGMDIPAMQLKAEEERQA